MGETCAVPKSPDTTKQALRLLDEVVAAHSNAEDRPQQHEMTKLVAHAADTREPLIVQAGTGTGRVRKMVRHLETSFNFGKKETTLECAALPVQHEAQGKRRAVFPQTSAGQACLSLAGDNRLR